MAYAGAEFAEKIIRALKGEKGIITPSYIHLSADKSAGAAVKAELGAELDYFSVKVELGENGVEKVHPIGKINEYEVELIKAAIPELRGNIDKGASFVHAPKL